MTAIKVVSDGQVQVTTNFDNCAPDIQTNTFSPTIISNWWTVSGSGIFSTNGTGLTAPLIPTDCGTYWVTFNSAYKNTAPCNDPGPLTATTSGSLRVVSVASLAPEGVTTLVANNPPTYIYWTTSNAAPVRVVASSCPSLFASELPDCWIMTPNNGNNRLEAYVPLTNAGRFEVVATAGTSAKTNVFLVVSSPKFKLLWETANKANQIYNPTPKDDPPVVLSNAVYMVEAPDNFYYATMDVDMAPAEARNYLLGAVYIKSTGEKVAGTDTRFWEDAAPVNFRFRHPETALASIMDFEFRLGFDINPKNNLLDSGEAFSLEVLNSDNISVGPPLACGTSHEGYSEALTIIEAGINATALWPHGCRLLQIFLDGGPGNLTTSFLPTSTATVQFNCFCSPYCEWLTHDSGAGFGSAGDAPLQKYTWSKNTSLASAVFSSPQIQSTAVSFYTNNLTTIVSNYFVGAPIGAFATFPLSGGVYQIPHQHEGATNFPTTTVKFHSPSSPDDLGNALLRARLLSHDARYTVQKTGNNSFKVTFVRMTGVVEDLYDFNRITDFPGKQAAIVQLGYGNGAYWRTNGIIFLDRIEFEQTAADPF